MGEEAKIIKGIRRSLDAKIIEVIGQKLNH
jgi:hypothetical protein